MGARERAMQDALYQQELHLQQAYEEDLAMKKVGAVRRDVQAINTQNLYAKYQQHWNVSICDYEVVCVCLIIKKEESRPGYTITSYDNIHLDSVSTEETFSVLISIFLYRS